ncbi:MAG TPA: Kdo hydroxylase family protein [Gammaproteobacteria bacterium]|nr:Kdo hydroxylase family protein [Gammaproteobacteria bacterium]
MTPIIELAITDWKQQPPAPMQERAVEALEAGGVLLFPRLGFPTEGSEVRFFTSAVAAKSKNVSLDGAGGRVRGSSLEASAAAGLAAMMKRYAGCSRRLLLNLLPRYEAGLIQGRTSYRPVEIKGRAASWRHDDTRLHVDSFPSSPVQGRRILRVFSNVHPHGQGRTWRLGGLFESVAGRYVPYLSGPLWGSGWLLHLCGVTKSRRSAYDHLMLQLHDHMKADSQYQSGADQITYDFPAGSTWIVFTDRVPHAAIAGRYALEQTFYLPISCMQDESKSPLRILERLTARKLA